MRPEGSVRAPWGVSGVALPLRSLWKKGPPHRGQRSGAVLPRACAPVLQKDTGSFL